MIQDRFAIAVGSERYLDCDTHTSLCVNSPLDNILHLRPQLTISHYTHNAMYVKTE